MLSCQQTQNVIDGKKRIILNPSEAQKRDFEAATFAEGEVYGMDVLISSGEDGKVRINISLDSDITYRLNKCAGSFGGITNDNLPARFDHHISAQNEELSCRFFWSAEKSRRVPL